MKNFINLLAREFRLFFNNTTILLVFFLAPVIYALFIGLTYQYGKVEKVPVLVSDEDRTPASAQLVEMLKDNHTIQVINNDIAPQSIKDEIIKKDAAAMIIIPENFEAQMMQGKYPEVNIYINTSNLLTANYATKAVQVVMGTYSAGAEMKALQKRGMSSEIAKTKYEPFKANYITLFNTTSNYLVFMWPAMMAVVLQQVILLAMALSFATEFNRSSFMEILDKTNSLILVFVKAIPVFLFSNINILVFYIFSKWLKIPVPTDFGGFILNSELFILASVFLSILVSIVVPNALKATQILMVIASPAFIMSGYTWPSYSMPKIINALTSIVPLTPYLQAMKISLVEQGQYYLTQPYTIHLLILSSVFFIMCWLMLIIKKKLLLKKWKHQKVTE
ncbi:MAG TPA: ABC transporter permease [Niabella sp.]|nr:ABC transporter permease [Niabella sp.]HOZ96739.1 ABC transporter permease [Niabella sp.]HQW14784.1 ABC transporter permease [Niabella sp.]HQX19964.1 ABC transporter permease [Niabella sp.]HQX42204.1 ABC transporter permease [Niabella sp.]